MTPTQVEQRVIQELKDNGISIIKLSEILPAEIFTEISQWAEGLLQEPETKRRIREIEKGVRPDSKSDKFFIVRPLGDMPSVSIEDRIVQVALSDPIMRIVCGYLGMFSRVAALDLWYNVATPGPDYKSQRWHRDPEDTRIVKTFLYLRDVAETNGPFCYIPGSHNGGPFREVYPQRVALGVYPKDGAVDARFPPNLRKVCTGEAGTFVLCDTTGFHRGGHPIEGGRLVFNAVYTTNAAAPMIAKSKQFSIRAPHSQLAQLPLLLSPAASYAIGHITGSARMTSS